MSNNSKHLTLLWQQFLQKIEKDWSSKYRSYGRSLNELENWTEFCEALTKDIEGYFQANGKSKKEIPVANTFYRLFQKGGLSPNTQHKTKSAIFKYLGYTSWAEFVSKNDTNAPLASNKSNLLSYLGKVPKYAYFLLGFLPSLLFSYLQPNQNLSKQAIIPIDVTLPSSKPINLPNIEISEIRGVIEGSNKLEFQFSLPYTFK